MSPMDLMNNLMPMLVMMDFYVLEALKMKDLLYSLDKVDLYVLLDTTVKTVIKLNVLLCISIQM